MDTPLDACDHVSAPIGMFLRVQEYNFTPMSKSQQYQINQIISNQIILFMEIKSFPSLPSIYMDHDKLFLR